MRLSTTLLAAAIYLPAAAQLPATDSLNMAEETREFAASFTRDVQRLHSNDAGHEGVVKEIFALYHDLSDEQMLLDRGILSARRAGRYVTPQPAIDFGVLPADSTLNTVQLLLETATDPQIAVTPLPEELNLLLDILVPFRYEEQKLFRQTVNRHLSPFCPRTVYPADSVLYINGEMLKRINAFSKAGFEVGNDRGHERNDFLTAEFSAKASPWSPYIYWIERPLFISAVIFEPGLQRAFINALANGKKGWGLLVERDQSGHWQIATAQVLYYAQ